MPEKYTINPREIAELEKLCETILNHPGNDGMGIDFVDPTHVDEYAKLNTELEKFAKPDKILALINLAKTTHRPTYLNASHANKKRFNPHSNSEGI